MAVTIQDFKDAWADKPNRDKAFALAEQYVAENEGILEPILGGKTSDELVAVVKPTAPRSASPIAIRRLRSLAT